MIKLVLLQFTTLLICQFFIFQGDLYAEPDKISPKKGWSDPDSFTEKDSSSTMSKILLWLPNRFLDVIDIFKIDLGVGPAVGGVIRVTNLGQAGYRQMLPLSVRLGAFGRDKLPLQIETANEIGIGPAFSGSNKRNVCPGEIGLGGDLFIAGGYVGICFDELIDFLGGIFLIDLKDDDL
ncbi:MAG TPA: hypothetical protein PKD37_04505 [Oligoflexia bacterium]|nr:hypothetical protein [Oligoflexia bacterium]HMP27227.1 hypothetical protein [Oligoflexia bacterium]